MSCQQAPTTQSVQDQHGLPQDPRLSPGAVQAPRLCPTNAAHATPTPAAGCRGYVEASLARASTSLAAQLRSLGPVARICAVKGLVGFLPLPALTCPLWAAPGSLISLSDTGGLPAEPAQPPESHAWQPSGVRVVMVVFRASPCRPTDVCALQYLALGPHGCYALTQLRQGLAQFAGGRAYLGWMQP